jgi:PAS domain S-box-containing protein
MRKTAGDLAAGEVANLAGTRPAGEIGEIYDAMNQMVNGIREKIRFAEQIGKGNYNATFFPISSLDKLGAALVAMRQDLVASTEALMEQDQRLVDAQRLARLGNFFYDLRTLKFQSSTTLNDILGFDDSFVRRNVDWRNHIMPEFHEAVTAASIEAIKTRSKFTQSYIVKRANDGKECWVNAIAEYNYDDDGRAISMFGTLQDISESKKLELDLNRSYQVAREQNSRLLNFSYIVSHNLRMHSVNIQSLLNLYAETDNEEERKEYISYMHIASDQLNETLFQLNEVVAMQNSLKLSLQPVHLRKAIEHTVDLLVSAINEKQGVIVNNVSDSIVINYNSVYMDSILLNFVSNAIKYSQPGRAPIVTISCYEEHRERENSHWVLEFADNGRGIDLDAHRDKIFGMYKTFHGNSDAKGIGLFMTKYQVEAMGGDIIVESKVGEGTTFKVLIK